MTTTSSLTTIARSTTISSGLGWAFASVHPLAGAVIGASASVGSELGKRLSLQTYEVLGFRQLSDRTPSVGLGTRVGYYTGICIGAIALPILGISALPLATSVLLAIATTAVSATISDILRFGAKGEEFFAGTIGSALGAWTFTLLAPAFAAVIGAVAYVVFRIAYRMMEHQFAFKDSMVPFSVGLVFSSAITSVAYRAVLGVPGPVGAALCGVSIASAYAYRYATQPVIKGGIS